jgi:signal transduction histidine kinase
LTLIISPIDELVRQAEVPLFIKTKLDLVLKNARRLLLIVNQLMDLQKNQSGSLTLRLTHSDLNAFLLEIYYTFKQIAESKQITFQYEAPEGEIPAYSTKACWKRPYSICSQMLSSSLLREKRFL